MLKNLCHKATTVVSEHEIGSKSYFKTIFQSELQAKNSRKHPICLEDSLLMLAVSPNRALELQQEIAYYKQQIEFVLQDPLNVTTINLQLQENDYLNISKNNLLYGIYYYIKGQNNFDELAFDDPIKHRQYQTMKEKMIDWIDSQPPQRQYQPKLQEIRYNETLICALYNSESYEQVQNFIQGHLNNTIVIVVNSHNQLNQGLKDILFQQNFNHDLFQSNQDINLRDGIMVLQYIEGTTNILFFITYQKLAHYQLISLAYDQIAKHFDPKYLWMTQVSIIPINKIMNHLVETVKNNAIVGACPQVKYNIDSCNFLNIRFALWFELQQKLYNSDFVNYNHDMWYCFYDWQKMKAISQLEFGQADTDLEFLNISQSPNFLFSNIALLMNQNIHEQTQFLFRIQQEPVYAGVVDIPYSIPMLIDTVRKQQNSQYYQSLQFYYFSDKILTVIANRETCNYIFHWLLVQYMNLRALVYLISHNIQISVVIYLTFNCSFQLIYNFDQINNNIQTIIGIIFPIITVILLLRQIVYNNAFNLQYLFNSMNAITVKGALCFYSLPNESVSKIIIQDDQDRELQPTMNIINQCLIITIQHKKKFYELKNRQLLQILSGQANTEQIKKLNGTFIFRQSKPAYIDTQFNNNQLFSIFYIGAAMNFVLMSAFVLDIIYSYVIPDSSAANMIVLISLAVCIICTNIQVLINEQRYNYIGFISNLIYYLPIKLGLHIYSIFNVDCAYDGSHLSQFYYEKVFKVSKLLALNCILMFIYVMIERALGYQGYILYGLIIYKALESILSLSFDLKKFCSKKQNVQSNNPIPRDPNPTYQINEEIFSFNEKEQLKKLFPDEQIGQDDVQVEIPNAQNIRQDQNVAPQPEQDNPQVRQIIIEPNNQFINPLQQGALDQVEYVRY